jgi:pilus assembly protein TadC
LDYEKRIIRNKMDLTKLPKHIKEKYNKKVRGKAIKKVQYDLNKANKSTEDVSDTKLEAMVVHKEKEIN